MADAMDTCALPALTPIAVRGRPRRRRPEDTLHAAIWRDLQPLLHPAVVAWSTENRHVGRIEGGRRRARGVLAGIPDMAFHWPHGQVCYVELKVDRWAPSEAQGAMHERLRAAGVEVRVCRTLDQVVRFLREQGCPLRVRGK